MDATNSNPGAFPPPAFPPPQGFPPPSSWPPPSAPSTPPPGAPRRHRRPAGLVAAAAVGLALGGLALVAGPRSGSASTPTASDLYASGTLDVNAVAAKVDPAIVDINTTLQGGAAAGTGMVLTSSGVVLTNNHVIDGATSIRVQIAGTGASHSATVLGYDATDDVALLQVQGVSNLPTVKIGDPSELQVGDAVLGLGNALGRGGTPAPALGSVTALGQTITATDEGGANPETLKNLIEVDAPIQPGDSGGPLVDANGNVVGMDSAGSASSGAGRFSLGGTSSTGDGFAIPIDDALAIARKIESGQSSSTVHIGDRAILGVEIDDSSASASSTGSGRFGGFNPFDPFGGSDNSSTSPSSNGAAVADVQPGSPADNAGIAAGDTITSIGTKSVGSADDLSSALGSSKPGDKVQVGWTDSSGQSHTATVTLVAGPPA